MNTETCQTMYLSGLQARISSPVRSSKSVVGSKGSYSPQAHEQASPFGASTESDLETTQQPSVPSDIG